MAKRLLCALAASFCCACLWALPGVKRDVEDTSGEYVYYKDFTFSADSYVGFLYYDEATWAARFWQSSDPKSKTPQKDISIYVSANPENTKGLELTGEKLIGSDPSSKEDTQIVNYLHELLYEFTSRRQKAVMQAGGGQTVSKQEFAQFGGDVQIVFDPLVPLFNIQEIKGSDKKVLFAVQVAGRLSSSSDESFMQFKGVEGLPKDKKRSFKKKRAKKSAAAFEGMSVTLDEQWQKPMDNLFVLGDFALLSMATINVPQGTKAVRGQLARRFAVGSGGSYALWSYKKIENEPTQKRLCTSSVFFDPSTGDVTRDFKIAVEGEGGVVSVLSLAVFDSVYQKNRRYFEGILKSFQLTP